LRLGFAVKVLGEPGLRSHDTRRWQNGPHLSVSLAYLRDIFGYLARAGISMYRMASQLAPYVTHPDLPQFHGQVEECRRELRALGRMAREQGLRLSFHPSPYVVLNAPGDDLAARSASEVEVLARMLDLMELGPEAVVVVHVGGAYENPTAARERFVRQCERLSTAARRRLVLENDDTRFSIVDTLWIHSRTGLRLVFDYLHHLNNPGGMGVSRAISLALETWPADQRPKVHFSSPRTEMRVVKRAGAQAGSRRETIRPPLDPALGLREPLRLRRLPAPGAGDAPLRRHAGGEGPGPGSPAPAGGPGTDGTRPGRGAGVRGRTGPTRDGSPSTLRGEALPRPLKGAAPRAARRFRFQTVLGESQLPLQGDDWSKAT